MGIIISILNIARRIKRTNVQRAWNVGGASEMLAVMRLVVRVDPYPLGNSIAKQGN